MKRILITGKDSYIGTNFKKYLEKYPNDYYVKELDVRNDMWKEFDFSKFEVVLHVAGLAHVKETKTSKEKYDTVNRKLTLEIANKAKKSGVSYFVFMSSMSVYGLDYSKKNITINTECNPNTYYGRSKYQAEKQLMRLENNQFIVCIVRPPMVYGENSPGNLTKLLKAVRKLHIFPTIQNERSSITVHKLCQEIKKYVDKNEGGIYLPQNEEYMCTVNIVKEKMEKERIKVVYTSLFNPIIRLMIGKNKLITKCFGDLKYER